MSNLTKAELELVSKLIDFGPEVINGIKVTGIEAALLDLARGAAALKMWDRVFLAKSAVIKLNPKTESFFKFV